jgi:hypothetical protein
MGLTDGLQNLLGLNSPTPSQGPKGPAGDNSLTALDLTDGSGVYTPQLTSWYSAKPYGFRMNTRYGSQFVMFLPISPSNLSITTNFATNVVPTLYGTVEEHSDVRYYDIVIEGTTGMTPDFVQPLNTTNNPGLSGTNSDAVAYESLKQPGRAKFPIASSAALGGFFSNTLGQISNILNQVNKITDTFSKQAEPNTAVYTDQTGYLAFHNLYRFLKRYKQDAAGLKYDGTPSGLESSTHPLTFFNYKDGNEYDVAIKSFVLRRSAENPMLYYYQIVMRGYNIRTSGSNINPDDLNQRLTDLGLNGVNSSSLLSTIKDVSSSAKAIVGSAVNGINLFGR